MDPRFAVPITRDDLYSLQMEVKQVQYTQSNHAERILRLEKRQTDDAVLKSVWNSPFPGVLAGTPQHGPMQIPQNDVFDDLDESGEQLLGSLHLGPAEEELPVRRGAASRANSVRFDESALHGSSWSGHNNRHSGEFGPPRPGSGLMMERSLSHKSDGRHSSAGHSVHSHHSVASGRASSFGLETNFAAVDDDDDDSSFDIPRPPVSFYLLGTVPSIVRCWLTTHYAHSTLLYADVCSGSQKSTVDYSLVKELDLQDAVERDVDGLPRIRLNVYFAEAVVTRHGNRSNSPEGAVPSMTVLFEVVGAEASGTTVVDRKALRIFVGSDALRAHSADILFSQNSMVLFGNERERLRVPFVRPEDEAVFRHIATGPVIPEKPKLNANAAPFIVLETNQALHDEEQINAADAQAEEDDHENASPLATQAEMVKSQGPSSGSEMSREDADRPGRATTDGETSGKEGSGTSEMSRRGSSTGIWGSWRQGAGAGPDGTSQSTSLSGYQPAARGTRNMKVLKSHKSGSSSASARPSASSDIAPVAKPGIEARRKSQVSMVGDSTVNGNVRWDAKRTVSSGAEVKPQQASRDTKNGPSLPRSANPVGVASAFSWMTPPVKSKPSTAAE
ncbi:hypothetical protein HJFPF1_02844 [Paramyrothecium foliicola]|nr:hypothetical protein HJFPF1_02844 [Paramyrothecium foliicola]